MGRSNSLGLVGAIWGEGACFWKDIGIWYDAAQVGATCHHPGEKLHDNRVKFKSRFGGFDETYIFSIMLDQETRVFSCWAYVFSKIPRRIKFLQM